MIEDNFLLQRIKNKILNNESNKGKILQAKSYYKNQNDIINKGVTAKSETKDPLRNADNRIPHNIHQLLVDEKISYLLTYPPIISVEDERCYSYFAIYNVLLYVIFLIYNIIE